MGEFAIFAQWGNLPSCSISVTKLTNFPKMHLKDQNPKLREIVVGSSKYVRYVPAGLLKPPRTKINRFPTSIGNADGGEADALRANLRANAMRSKNERKWL